VETTGEDKKNMNFEDKFKENVREHWKWDLTSAGADNPVCTRT
jgi:hypothetical protein